MFQTTNQWLLGVPFHFLFKQLVIYRNGWTKQCVFVGCVLLFATCNIGEVMAGRRYLQNHIPGKSLQHIWLCRIRQECFVPACGRVLSNATSTLDRFKSPKKTLVSSQVAQPGILPSMPYHTMESVLLTISTSWCVVEQFATEVCIASLQRVWQKVVLFRTNCSHWPVVPTPISPYKLVGGFNPFWKILVTWDDYSQYMEK